MSDPVGDVVLDGCRPEPLGAYLKALGVFRLVAEQLDAGVTARWAADRCVLTTDRSLDDIVDFFADAYRPTPIVSPWNGGSGFHLKDNVEGIEAVEASGTPRLAAFRTAITTARELVADDRWSALPKESQVRLCRNELPDLAVPWLDAAVVLSESGAVFPPILGTGGNVGRLDFSNNFMQQVASILCLRQGRGAPDRDRSIAWLRAALGVGGDHATVTLVKKAVGQFDPGAAGGTNAPVGGVEESLVNPWDFVLTFEGALLFASGAARRMGAGTQGRAAMPFTFDTSPVGYGSAADGENAKGELWAPLWERPARLAEVARLLGEGRTEWNGGHARRGIDAARAAGSLGVDRGISGFVRHAFVERMGQAMLAVPVGRIAAAAERRDDVGALAELDAWVDRLRREKNLATGPARLLRRLDEAMFELATARATSGARPQRLQDVLVVAGALDRAVARSRTLRDVVDPLGNPAGRRTSGWRRPLASARWWPLLDDGSVELRLARALASGREPRPGSRPEPSDANADAVSSAVVVGGTGTDVRDSEKGEPAIRGDGDDRSSATASGGPGNVLPDRPATLLRGVELTPGSSGSWRLAWRPGGRPVVGGLGIDSLVDVLGAFVQRRAIDAGMRTDAGERGRPPGPIGRPEQGDGRSSATAVTMAETEVAVGRGQIGVDPAYAVRAPASLDDVLDFVDGAVDESRLERSLGALLLLRFGGGVVLPESRGSHRRAIHPAVALVLPFFHGRPLWLPRDVCQEDREVDERSTAAPDAVGVRLRAGRDWPRLLAAGRVDEVIDDALHRLRVARLVPLVADSRALSCGVDGPRLLAAAAFPLADRDAARLLGRVAVPSDSDSGGDSDNGGDGDGDVPPTYESQEEP